MSEQVTSTSPQSIETDSTELQQVTSKTCDNCHAQVNGMYCSQCGQSVESTLKYFWTVILHLLDDIFSFDSRASRTLFPLIFRPGYLTNEYIAGRRVHYVPPLRLYLFISIVFFITLKFFAVSHTSSDIFNLSIAQQSLEKVTTRLTTLQDQNSTTKDSAQQDSITSEIERLKVYQQDLSVNNNLIIQGLTKKLVELEFKRINQKAPFSEAQQQKFDDISQELATFKNSDEVSTPRRGFTLGNQENGDLSFDFLSDESNQKLTQFSKLLTKKAEKAFTQDSTPLIREAIEKLPQLMFVILPLFAALLKIIYLFSKRLYLEHLTVALHSHSFIFISILLVELLSIGQVYLKNDYSTLASITDKLINALLVWVPIYLFVMQRKVYKQGYLLTFIKYSIVGISYLLMIALTGTVAFIWGLAST